MELAPAPPPTPPPPLPTPPLPTPSWFGCIAGADVRAEAGAGVWEAASDES